LPPLEEMQHIIMFNTLSQNNGDNILPEIVDIFCILKIFDYKIKNFIYFVYCVETITKKNYVLELSFGDTIVYNENEFLYNDLSYYTKMLTEIDPSNKTYYVPKNVEIRPVLILEKYSAVTKYGYDGCKDIIYEYDKYENEKCFFGGYYPPQKLVDTNEYCFNDLNLCSAEVFDIVDDDYEKRKISSFFHKSMRKVVNVELLQTHLILEREIIYSFMFDIIHYYLAK
jgi:hypothetical protein